MAKDSIVFYKSFYDVIKEMPPENQVEIYNAIFTKYFYDEEVELQGISKGIVGLMIPNIDSANKRYQASVENGKKGGRPKNLEKPKNNLEITQQEPGNNLNVNVNDNVNDNVNSSVCDILDSIVGNTLTHTDTISYALSKFDEYKKDEIENSCNKFYKYYNDKKWRGVKNWKSKLELWIQTDINNGLIKRSKPKIETIDGITYENGVRLL